QKALQDKRRCDLIDHSAMLLARAASFVKNPVRLARGQALVAHVDGQASEFATTMPRTLKRRASLASERTSSRGLRCRSSVSTGCAVSPSSSDTATPM